ncbi:hypothetical protein LB505_009772 [Fusarium chuoi]|nr:hypothetical protein LB505_009772 [Fusarium chuoi]
MSDNTSDQLCALKNLAGKTVIITGGANGIGAETHPSSALFISVNILLWDEMKALFSQSIRYFGKIDIVVANAGIMDSQSLFDVENVDEQGELHESAEGFHVIDVNLKGTINTLRLALHHMQHNQPVSPKGQRGSVVFVTSTSGYFGTTGVGAYITSKHGLTGLLRASQQVARGLGIGVNAVAPFFTPTSTFKDLAETWKNSGLKSNTPENVAQAIVLASVRDETGKCCMVVGGKSVEVEDGRNTLLDQWLGRETTELLQSASRLFEANGYPLPKGLCVQVHLITLHK